MDIRGGGHHRRGVQFSRQGPGQGVGPADVAGEQRDHKLPQLVQADHRRVPALVPDKGRDLPDGNTAGGDENHGVRPGKALPVKIPGGLGDRVKVLPCQPRHGIAADFLPGKRLFHPAGGFQSLAAVGENSRFH